MDDGNPAFCGETKTDGYRVAALALLDAADGKPLWNTTLEHEVPAETCVEVGIVYLAMMARGLGMTPRQACDQLFKECPSDEAWQTGILPLMDRIAAAD